MNKVISIIKKELAAYFKSPIAYIILIILISVFNVFFFMIINQNREAVLKDMFSLMEFMFVFFVPILTMNVFSQEKASGTMEFLMTSPVTNRTIVAGKYLGSALFFSCIIFLTLPYYFILEYFSQPDAITIWSGYFGVWLEGLFFIAIGVMASSWTKNPIIAALSTYVILFFLYFSVGFAQYFSGKITNVLNYLCTLNHAQNFFTGLVMLDDVVYYLTGIIFCLTITRLSIETRLTR